MSQSDTERKPDPGWQKAAAKVNAANQCRLPESVEPDLPSEPEMTGEEIRALFTANINRSAAAKAFHKNPILELVKTYPVLGSCGGSSRAFDRNIEAVKCDKRLTEKYSERQLIALAAAKTLLPHLDYPPQKLSQLHAVCCHAAGCPMPQDAIQ
ncbi:hypothetical protein [Methylomonas sp. MgM2]